MNEAALQFPELPTAATGLLAFCQGTAVKPCPALQHNTMWG